MDFAISAKTAYTAAAAMTGQIDMFSKLENWFKDNALPLKFGDGGFSLVMISLIFSLFNDQPAETCSSTISNSTILFKL
ncbi:835_t:CDS:2 [Entrophospora sp. SA101]|nr:835_t:CDS:2 [Entrophospora sp. SA101]